MSKSKYTETLLDQADEYQTAWAEEKNYKFVRNTNDPRFGDVSILKNQLTGDVVFAKEKIASSKKEATTDIIQLKNRMQLNHNNTLQMTGYSTEIKKQLCSTNYITRGYYRYPQTDLHRELINHKKNLTSFSSQQLNQVMNDSLSALNHLHGKGLYHGDIRPLHIGQERTTNHYQLLDRFSDPSPLEKVQINNLVGKKDLYMSPQLYRKLKAKKRDEVYDDFANDYHALGLTMLVLGTQDGVQDVYSSNGEWDHDVLNSHLNNFRNKYGNDPSLCQNVENLIRNGQSYQTYSQNQHYTQANPQADYFNVQSTPYQQGNYTYVQSTPQQHVTYVNATPQQHVTYVNATPQRTETYVNSTPQTYVQSNVNTQVNENVQTRVYSSWEEYKQANPDVEIIKDEHGNIQVQGTNNTVVSQVQGEPHLVRTYTQGNGQVNHQTTNHTVVSQVVNDQQVNQVSDQQVQQVSDQQVQQVVEQQQEVPVEAQTNVQVVNEQQDDQNGRYVMKEDGTVVLESNN